MPQMTTGNERFYTSQQKQGRTSKWLKCSFEPGCLAKLTKLLCAVWKCFTLEICSLSKRPCAAHFHPCTQLHVLNSFCMKYCCFCFLTGLYWVRAHNAQHTMHNRPVSNNEFVFPGDVAAHWLSSPPLVCAESPSLVSERTSTAELPPTIGKMNTRVHVTSYLRQMQVSWEPFKVGFRCEMKISLAFVFPLYS